jgi:hypothetical protein
MWKCRGGRAANTAMAETGVKVESLVRGDERIPLVRRGNQERPDARVKRAQMGPMAPMDRPACS